MMTLTNELLQPNIFSPKKILDIRKILKLGEMFQVSIQLFFVFLIKNAKLITEKLILLVTTFF